jgi:hypothetical protein
MAARLLAAVLTGLVLVSAALAANDPRAEKRRLRPADVALAKRTNVNLSDLGRGWRSFPASAKSGSTPSCPGYRPDFSRFTITGEAVAGFVSSTGASLVSSIQVYPSRAQAAADFKLGVRPGFAKCLGQMFETDIAKGAGGRGTTLSVRMLAGPRAGERAAWYRLVGRLTIRGTTIPVHMDFLAVQQGRSQAGMVLTGLGAPQRGQVALTRRLAARMR